MDVQSALVEIEEHIRRMNDRRMYERLQAIHLWLLLVPVQHIAQYIGRVYGLQYSLRGVSKLMERMNMSYTRPTYTLATADLQK
ncbi:MAG: winged helix-turn-helix domain-containing protein [Alicyclobacillaceae bacterium]|nr:winged helix-turn-helix domain-containing protein [Alicyclobacillaceae bacterium]